MAEAEYGTAVLRLEASDKRLGQDLEKSKKTVGAKLGSIAKIATGIGVAALAGVATASVGMAKQLEKSFAEVRTLLPDISNQSFDEMRTGLRGLQAEFAILSDDAVPALYQAISASVPPSNVIEFMEIASKASIGGITSLETAVDGLSTIVNTYGDEVIGAGQVSDIMFTTVKLGKTTFDQLSRTLYNVVPTAKSLGIGFDQVGAALATMTAQGVPTAQATTQLRQLFVELSKETDLADAVMAKFGKSFAELSGEGVDFATVMQGVRDSMPEAEFRKLFSSVEAQGAALLTTGDAFDRFKDSLEATTTAAGATEAAFKTMSETASFKMDKALTALKLTMENLGTLILPVLATAVTAALTALKAIGNWIRDTGIAVWKAIKEPVLELYDAITVLVDEALDALQSAFGDADEPGRTFGELLRDLIVKAAEAAGKAIDLFKTALDGVITFVQSPAFSKGLNWLSEKLDLLGQAARDLAQGLGLIEPPSITPTSGPPIDGTSAPGATPGIPAPTEEEISGWTRLGEAIRLTARAIGAFFGYFALGIATISLGIGWLTTKFDKMSPVAQTLATIIGGVLAGSLAVSLGPAIWGVVTAIGGWIVALLAAIGPVGWIILAVIALIAAIGWLAANWDELGPLVEAAWESVKKYTADAWAAITLRWRTAWDSLSLWWRISMIKLRFRWLLFTNRLKQIATDIWAAISLTFTSAWNAIALAIGVAWTTFQAETTALWNDISQFFADTWAAIKKSVEDEWDAISRYLSNAWTTFQTETTALWNAISTFFTDTWSTIAATFSGWLLSIQLGLAFAMLAIETGINVVWAAISAFFTTTWTAIATTVSEWLVSIQADLTAVWLAVQTEITTIWNALLTFFTEIWSSIATTFSSWLLSVQLGLAFAMLAIETGINVVWAAISAFFTTTWTAIATTVSEWLVSIQADLTAVWLAVQTEITTIWNALLTFFTDTWSTIAATFSGWLLSIQLGLAFAMLAIETGINVVWAAISAFFTTTWTAIATTVSEWLVSIQADLTAVWLAVQTEITTIWNALLTFFTEIWSSIATTFSSWLLSVQLGLAFAMLAIETGINVVWAAISAFFTTTWTAIATTVSEWLVSIQADLTAVWLAVQTEITTIWNALLTFFTEIWSDIPKTFASALNLLSLLLILVWAAMQLEIQTVWNNISQFFADIWFAIKNTVANKLQDIVNDVTAKWNDIKHEIDEKLKAIKSAVETKWAEIVELVSGWYNDIKDKFDVQNWGTIGNGIIDGIKAGVTAKANSIANAAASAVRNAIAAAKAAVGIQSPSRLAAVEIGQPFVEGIAQGIEQAEDALMARLAAMLSRSTYAVNAGRYGTRVARPGGYAPAGAPRNAGGGTTVVNNYHIAGSILAEQELKKLVNKNNEQSSRDGRSYTGGGTTFSS